MSESRRTRRWLGVLGVPLAGVAVGVFTGSSAPLLAATVGLAFVTYPLLLRAPEPALSVRRTLSTTAPRADERVRVEVTATNRGSRTLPDVRVEDGVPPRLTVVDGTPRAASALRPGESVTFEYVVRGVNGPHRFDPASVVARDISGAVAVETEAGESTPLLTAVATDGADLLPRSHRPGPASTRDEYGDGQTFQRVREYRPGDPIGRLDWRRFAKNGTLSTVEFRQTRAAGGLLMLDARPVSQRSGPDGLPATVHVVAAADAVRRSVADAGGRVGLATLGTDGPALPVASGRSHSRLVGEELARFDGSTEERRDEDGEQVETEIAARARRLSTDDRVVFFSPLLDDDVVDAVESLRRRGYSVAVVSPDVTRGGRLSTRMAHLERRARLRRLAAGDGSVTDWDPRDRLRSSNGSTLRSAHAAPGGGLAGGRHGDDVTSNRPPAERTAEEPRTPTLAGATLSVVAAGLAIGLLASGGLEQLLAAVSTLGCLGVLLGQRLRNRGRRRVGGALLLAGLAGVVGAATGLRPDGGLVELLSDLLLVGGLWGVTLGVVPLRERYARSFLAAGGASLITGVVLEGGLFDPPLIGLLAATALAVLAWDVGEQAVSLGATVGECGSAHRADVVHDAGSALVGAVGVSAGLLASTVPPLELPAIAVGALLVGLSVLLLSLYP